MDEYERHTPTGQLAGAGPILVTGTPYSGTTWFGRTLSRIGELPYLHEAFNRNSPLFGYGLRFEKSFTFVVEQNEEIHLDALRRIEQLRPAVSLSNVWRNPRLFRCEFGEWRKRRRDRLKGGRSVWKDPMAVLSSGWICRRFDASVILLARHPAAFTMAAMKRSDGRSGTSGVDGLLDQPHFMNRYGERFGSTLEAMQGGQLPPHIEKATLWRVLLEVAVDGLRGLEARCRIVRFEDICQRPEHRFTELLRDLGVAIRRDVSEVVEDTRGRHAHRRRTSFDMRESLHGWRDRFSPSEVDEIMDAAGPLAPAIFDVETSQGDGDDGHRTTISIDELVHAIDGPPARGTSHASRAA